MKSLYLTRHAKSSWKHPELSDHDRPLNKRGKANAPEMGERLKHKNVIPTLIISSTAKRAKKTAIAIAEAIDYPSDQIYLNNNLYHADKSEILDEIRALDDRNESIMIFGHNPGLTCFANAIANLSIDNIPTCGIIALQLNIEKWQDINWGCGSLFFYDYPKKSK